MVHIKKAIVTYDGGNVNGIHHTGGIFQRGGQLKLFNHAKFSLQNIERSLLGVETEESV